MSAHADGAVVYLAYAEVDAEAATRVAAALEARGWRCFLARRDIGGPATGDWLRALDEALGRARVMVVIVTDASLASTWVGDEVGYFRARARRGEVSTESPIPFRLSGPPVERWPPTWQFVQHVDATRPGEWDRAVGELGARVAALLSREDGRGERPPGPPSLPPGPPAGRRSWQSARAFALVVGGVALGYPLGGGRWPGDEEPTYGGGIGEEGLTEDIAWRLRGADPEVFRSLVEEDLVKIEAEKATKTLVELPEAQP